MAGNRAIASLLSVQRDPPTSQRGDVDQRVAVLEKRQSATELDLAWRATFGSRLSTYRQAIYALTAGYQAALIGFNQAHSDQAQAEAIKDQVGMALVNVVVAGAAQPFLAGSLGGLGPRLDAAVEFIENPLVAAGQGVTSTAATRSGQTGAPRAPAPPPGMGGGDPLTFLSQNLAAVESRNQAIERAFGSRVTQMSSYTDEQWMSWDRSRQAAAYQRILTQLDDVALSDASQLLSGPTLAVTMELYFWSRWISNQYIPGVRGLQIGSHLARRMQAIGVESLAGGIHFDTSSWIFMEHSPEGWDTMLVGWARGYNNRLTR